MTKETQNDMLLTSSSVPLRSSILALADELSEASDAIKWSRAPELSDLEKVPELATIAGYYCLEDLMGTSAPGRVQVYKVLAEERPSGSRAMRKILDARAPLPKKTVEEGAQL